MTKGRVWKFGEHIDTDVIIPARYLNTSDPNALAKHCMEGVRPDFAARVQRGDILVAGDNFGCGSSREHAPIAIKALGISCVVARSFARIFFRNAINIGLPIVESREAADDAQEGDILEVDLEAGLIRNPRLGKEYRVPPFPPEIRAIIAAGGLMAYVAGSGHS